jgi:hypothetical protein
VHAFTHAVTGSHADAGSYPDGGSNGITISRPWYTHADPRTTPWQL